MARRWAYISLAVAKWGKPVLRFVLGAHWIVVLLGGAEDDDGGDDDMICWPNGFLLALLLNEERIGSQQRTFAEKIAKSEKIAFLSSFCGTETH